MNHWEFSTACHESAHAVVAHVLGAAVDTVFSCRDGTLQNGMRGCVTITPHADTVREAAIFFAGAVGSAWCCGVRYLWADPETMFFELAAYRAEKRRLIETPRPVDLAPVAAEWDTPQQVTAAGLSAWAHGGRAADVVGALDVIRSTVKSVEDPAERNIAEGTMFDEAQHLACDTVKRHLEAIRRLAVHLVDNGGRLTGEQVATFFEREGLTASK